MLRCIKQFDPRLFAWIALNAVTAALGNIVPIVFPKLIVDELTAGGSTERVIWIAAAFGLSLFVTSAITGISYGLQPDIPSGSMSIRFIALRIKFHIRQNLKLMTMDYQNLENPDVLDKFNRAERAFYGNYNGLEGMSRQVLTMFRSLLTVIGTVTIVAVMGHWLMLVVIAALAVNYIVSERVSRRNKKLTDELARLERQINYVEHMSYDFTYGKDIRIYGFKDLIMDIFCKDHSAHAAQYTKIHKGERNVQNVSAVTAFVQEAAMYAWLCWRVIAGAVSIGSFLMYITAIRTFSDALNAVMNGFVQLSSQSRRISDWREFDDIQDAPGGSEIPSADIQKSGGVIEFDKVSFKYPGSDKYAVKDMSLTIGAQEKLAVVGLNGAGKTTFIKLLMRLYSPESGRILLNGVDIQTYDRDEYYKLFAAVFQEINLFAFTVTENISMRTLNETDNECISRSLEQAGLSGKISGLDKGVHTPMLKALYDDGVEFSGGETQKLALARALYKNAPFIVLDEPTAALDALAEERLYNEFDRLSAGKTAVYISHRLASTRFCDRIVMFENGAVAEVGSHDELLTKGGKYADLFAVQAQYYKDNPTAVDAAESEVSV
jgi:ATP-binding cassette subfamily C protein